MTRAPRWISEAACRGTATAVWFPGRGGDPEPARLICSACPVRTQCLTDAVARRETHGMWGGAAGRTLRTLRRAFAARTHANPLPQPECTCTWCQAVATHHRTLDALRIGAPARFRRPTRPNLDGLTHGHAATYNEGCRCDPCSLAKAIKPTRRAS